MRKQVDASARSRQLPQPWRSTYCVGFDFDPWIYTFADNTFHDANRYMRLKRLKFFRMVCLFTLWVKD